MLFFLTLTVPLLGTVLGSAAVFFLYHKEGKVLSASLGGFAAGVMTAASFFSLLLPALSGDTPRIVALSGLLAGFVFVLLIERFFAYAPKGALVDLVITLHNLPEGLAVGIALAGSLDGSGRVTPIAALMLSVGIAIQNIPEGAIISLPNASLGKGRAFLKGSLSGVVEPIGALLAFFLSGLFSYLLPFLLAFAAASMLASVAGELSAYFQGREGRWGQCFYALGFLLMTALDVLLG